MPAYIPPPSSLPPGSSVWAYLRDSGGPSQGESIERQRTEIREYCTRHGLKLVHVYQDEASSGGSVSGREDFEEMIYASARTDHPAGLLIWDFARFSRSLDDSGYYKAVLRKHGLVVHSITDAVPDGPYSRMVELVIDIANEEKRRQVKRDTASGLRRIVEQYGAMPGPAPIGYKREPVDAGLRRDGSKHILHRWVPDPDKTPLVLKAFEMRAAGATFAQVQKATHLFVAKNSYTTFFNNTIYKGEIYFSGKFYPCMPIVSVETWEAVQRLGELRGRYRYGPQGRRAIMSSYLLSGFLFCQECGAPLYGYELMKRKKYYVCSRAKRRHDCPARHIPADQLEAGVVARVLEDILTLENLLRIQAALKDEWGKLQRELSSAQADDQKKLALAEKRIRNITAAIGDSGSTRALLDALHVAEAERDRLEYKLGHLPIAPAGLDLPRISLEQIAISLRNKLNGESLDEKKSVLRQVIARILVIRNDTEIRALIEYHLPEINIPPQSGGDISNNDSGPEGRNSLLLIIPIKRKYILKTK
jgi:DNA invertase Pin-like site-specific DNA recombinase